MESNVAATCRRLMSGLSRNVTAPKPAVTHRDTHDKFATHAAAKVPVMKTKTMYLTNLLLALTPLVATLNLSAASASESEPVLLRYQRVATNFTLSVNHDIKAGEKETPVAERKFTMEYELHAQLASGSINAQLKESRASYTAHGMNQRLGTHHLVGRDFGLAIRDEGRVLQASGPGAGKGLDIDLGFVTDGGYALDGALADMLPVLPENPVSVGSNWDTQRDVRTLVGWAWAQGQLDCHHQVTAVEQQENHTIVAVTSNAATTLSAVADSEQYSGDGELKRNYQWRFDATDGRLLSLSLEQESNGFSALPQGNVQIRQLTTIELSSE